MGSHDADVVVIGGGVSGLYAARCLEKHGVKVLVLESRDRIAGRLFRVQDARCGYVDLGGAYVGKQQTKLLSVAQDLGIHTYRVDDSLKTYFTSQAGRMVYEGTVPSMNNPLGLLDMNNLIRLVDTWSKQVPLESPWEAERAEEWDAMSVQDFIDKYAWTSIGKLVGRMSVIGPLLTEPRHVSLLFYLHFVRSCGGSMAICNVTNGLQEMKFDGGSALLCEKLAEGLTGRVELNQVVTDIDETDDGVTITTADDHQYKTRRVITAIPPPALSKITCTPALPADLQGLITVRQKNHCIKTVTYYERRFWREQGFSGQLISQNGIICYAVDDTKPDGAYPAIMGFINGDKADEYSGLSKDERKKLICEQYACESQLKEFLHPVFYIEKDWKDADEEQHTGHCCVHALPAGVLTKHKTKIGERIGKLHFAGTEASVVSKGYIDGALRAAERAASEVLNELGIFTVNLDRREKLETEIEYLPSSYVERHLPSIPQLGWLVGSAVVIIVGLMLQI